MPPCLGDGVDGEDRVAADVEEVVGDTELAASAAATASRPAASPRPACPAPRGPAASVRGGGFAGARRGTPAGRRPAGAPARRSGTGAPPARVRTERGGRRAGRAEVADGHLRAADPQLTEAARRHRCAPRVEHVRPDPRQRIGTQRHRAGLREAVQRRTVHSGVDGEQRAQRPVTEGPSSTASRACAAATAFRWLTTTGDPEANNRNATSSGPTARRRRRGDRVGQSDGVRRGRCMVGHRAPQRSATGPSVRRDRRGRTTAPAASTPSTPPQLGRGGQRDQHGSPGPTPRARSACATRFAAARARSHVRRRTVRRRSARAAWRPGPSRARPARVRATGPGMSTADGRAPPARRAAAAGTPCTPARPRRRRPRPRGSARTPVNGSGARAATRSSSRSWVAVPVSICDASVARGIRPAGGRGGTGGCRLIAACASGVTPATRSGATAVTIWSKVTESWSWASPTDPACGPHQLAERRPLGQVEPQHDLVDEHADDVRQLRQRPAGDGARHHHVLAAEHPAQRRRVRREQAHERGGALGPDERVQRRHDVVVEGEARACGRAGSAAPAGACRASGPGWTDRRARARQWSRSRRTAGPVGALLLPGGEVGVLHGQLGPVRRAAGEAVLVGGGQVPDEDLGGHGVRDRRGAAR